MKPINILAIIMLLILSLKTLSQPQDECITPLNSLDESRFELKVLEQHEMNIEKVGKTKITLFHIPNWTDPGDLLKVKVTNAQYNLSLTNIDGWVRFDNNYSVSEELKSLNKLNTDLALLVSRKNFNYLILFGWVYASEPGLCTIIDLNSGEMVYNINSLLTNIDVKDQKFIFENKFQSNNCFD